MSTPLRVGFYTRVSAAEQALNYSLAAQRHAAERRWPDADLTVYEEAGRSAFADSIAKRPVFAKLLADAEAGRLDVVAVHDITRFARRNSVSAVAFERLDKAGVGFVSLSENIDYSTPTGRLMIGVLSVVAQHQAEALRGHVKKGQAEFVEQGGRLGTTPRYTLRDERGHFIPDTTPAFCSVATRREHSPFDVLVRQLELLATHSDNATLRTLIAEGWLPKETQRQTIRRAIVGGAAEVYATFPEPVPTLLARAQARPRIPPVREGAATYSLSGLLRCACGIPLNIHKVRLAAGLAYYIEAGIRRRDLLAPCPHHDRYPTLAEAEEEAFFWLKYFAWTDKAQDHWRQLIDRDGSAEYAKREARRLLLKQRIDRWHDLWVEDRITKAELDEKVRPLDREMRSLQGDPAQATLAVVARFNVGAVDHAWATMNAVERNHFLRQFVTHFIVRQGKVRLLPRFHPHLHHLLQRLGPDGDQLV